jgi:hypothetical protein
MTKWLSEFSRRVHDAEEPPSFIPPKLSIPITGAKIKGKLHKLTLVFSVPFPKRLEDAAATTIY